MIVLKQAHASLKIFVKTIQFDYYVQSNLYETSPDTFEMNHVKGKTTTNTVL